MELDVAASRGQKCDVAAAVSGFSDASQAVHGSEEYELKEGTNTVLINELHEAVNAHPEDPSLHFDLGLFLWEKGPNSKENKERAANHFLTSAKLNPQNGAAFRYLGHYYASLSLDMQRALKCYQRAVTLNPDDSLSGEALCDLLDQGGKEIMQVSVCREASGKSPRAFWAFRRLGYLQVHQKKWSAAVQSLQHAIRGYPNCCDLWEALGLAYQRLGRFTAAIKSYGRAIELEDTSIFASIESGNIFLMLGSFRKGVEKFQHALEISPQNIAAQFGVSFGLLCLAKECIQLGAFRWASSLLEEASQVAEASTRLAGNLSCLWKLHGDIQLLYAKCFPWMDKSGGLERDVVAFNASILSWKKTCTLAAISASCSYQRALRLAPWQANIYTDIAIASDLTSHLNSGLGPDADIWKLPEKLALGSLLLEGDNYDFWVALGYLSHNNALKQHALIRGLQLDVALAFAWAHLGKLYRNMDEKQLARQAFDCARSIDPSLAIPWAGMSADFDVMESTSDEAFQSCLYAVQISPIAEFQIGLAKLALHSGQLSSSQLFRAICQAVQLAPHYPESHNLNGLVCEARLDYQSAATSYKRARCAVNISSDKVPKDLTRDISINLARSLSKVGNSGEALMECEILKKEGMLDIEGLQLYAFSLWQVGKNEEALSVARNLAGSISSIGGTSVAASVSFICRLLYSISGLDSAIISIQRMPKKMFQSSKISLVVSAIHAFDQSNRLESIVSSSRSFLNSHEEITRMHFLIALSKLVKNGSECSLGFQSGVAHLRKALHMYPNSNLIRNLLGYLLLFTEDSNHCHMATRCCKMYASNYQNQEGVKCATEILGAGAVACYSVGNSNPKFSFPTCKHQCLNDHGAVRELQRYLHQEPWNHNARYLLVLNFLQKAREERFPYHLGVTLGRLIKVALSCRLCSTKNMSYQYQKFQLLLCASELSLQGGNQSDCIEHAKNASVTLLPDNYLFFVHLMLCRAYAAENDVTNLQMEYIRCLELKTDYQFGWICLKFMESQYNLQENLKRIDLIYEECSKGGKDLWNISMPLFYLLKGLISIRDQDLVSAEECLSQACSFAYDESCLFLCHGATCIELSRKLCSSHYLLLAVKSLTRAQETCVISVPIVSILLAQAKGSLGSKESWEKNLRLEWYSWPPEMRPAELFFQMHVLGRQAMGKEYGPTSSNVELCQSPKRWVLRAIHTNPSCMRFWEVLQKVAE